jgi:hypothetical protein
MVKIASQFSQIINAALFAPPFPRHKNQPEKTAQKPRHPAAFTRKQKHRGERSEPRPPKAAPRRGSKPEMPQGGAGSKERTPSAPGATGSITLLDVTNIQQTASFLNGGLQTVCLGKHPKVTR